VEKCELFGTGFQWRNIKRIKKKKKFINVGTFQLDWGKKWAHRKGGRERRTKIPTGVKTLIQNKHGFVKLGTWSDQEKGKINNPERKGPVQSRGWLNAGFGNEMASAGREERKENRRGLKKRGTRRFGCEWGDIVPAQLKMVAK